VKPPFYIPIFNVFLHLTLNFNNPKSIISLLNFFQSKLSSCSCSNPLLPLKTLNRGYTVISSARYSKTSRREERPGKKCIYLSVVYLIMLSISQTIYDGKVG
jgi:hypothetical protein